MYQLTSKKFLSKPEIDALIASLRRFEHKSPRNTLMIELALATGARASELLAITIQDVNQQDRTVLIRGIKNSNDREIPLRPALFGRIMSLELTCDRLFPITYPRLVQIWNEFKPCPKSFHALRHTFAMSLYEKTKDIRLTMAALGHRDIKNTMIYADYQYSKKEFLQIIS